VLKDVSFRARRCQSIISKDWLDPLRVLDSRGWPDLSRDLPLDSCFRSAPDNLSDLNVPMLSLGVLGRDDFAQVRWGPKKIILRASVEHPL
jgi:hypothetical protein